MPEYYFLMNKNENVALIQKTESFGTEYFSVKKQYEEYTPYGFQDMNTWLEGRQAAKRRKSIAKLMKEVGIYSRSGFIAMTKCTSLTDTFWVKPTESDLQWEDVSLYRNPFDETIARIAFDGTGMYGQKFSTTSPELTTDGAYEKCWIRENNQISLIKRGSSEYANAGVEPYGEALATQLLKTTKTEHVPYELINYRKKLASKCPIFTSEKYGYVPFASYAQKRTEIGEKMQIMSGLGLEQKFREMIVMDAIMLNVDRHDGNFGFLVENKTGEIVDMAPLFDENQAYLPGIMRTDDVNEYLMMQGPRIGDDFVPVAKAVLTSDLQTTLINLKHFEYTDPGYNFPKWRLELISNLKDRQINEILGKSRIVTITKKKGEPIFTSEDELDNFISRKRSKKEAKNAKQNTKDER